MSPTRPLVLLVLSVVGMLSLIAFEIMRGMSGDNATEMFTPLVVMMCIASLPALLLAIFSARWAYWGALALAALLSLFHTLHVVEHAMGGDYAITALIIVTMLIPTAGATVLLWQQRKIPETDPGLLAAS